MWVIINLKCSKTKTWINIILFISAWRLRINFSFKGIAKSECSVRLTPSTRVGLAYQYWIFSNKIWFDTSICGVLCKKKPSNWINYRKNADFSLDMTATQSETALKTRRFVVLVFTCKFTVILDISSASMYRVKYVSIGNMQITFFPAQINTWFH